ncbi:hypothetical protein A0H81_09990 [Grifola frondosa]|uniref:Uncharacterized protein n=1 Tax=Grifola frondosa TaxID=5627 RepID=A0A1C7M187_GRIFR|nr:hypothetical protein A0H81_09990 [Grifola frondosa]
MADLSTAKIPLPVFLKVLTSNGVPASKAMTVASRIYKTYNTPESLGQLTVVKLSAAGVDDKELRKLVLTAIRKAGYKGSSPRSSASSTNLKDTPNAAGPSTSQTETRAKKRGKRDDDLNGFLPDRPADEGESYGSLEFNEVLDEEAIKTKHTVINRAPIMTAWAFVVAERLGFQREEALSVASVYTEMNAITKGVSLGIFEEGKNKGMEASRHGAQPYVELMGRRPLYQTASSHWRALSAGAPVPPTPAFSYITRALRQTTPHILGALRLLAASYPPAELNSRGFALYADFRPSVEGWGKRGEVHCSRILALRKAGVKSEETAEDEPVRGSEDIVKVEPAPEQGRDADDKTDRPQQEGPPSKKSRRTSLDEYDAALEEDPLFDSIDFDSYDLP